MKFNSTAKLRFVLQIMSLIQFEHALLEQNQQIFPYFYQLKYKNIQIQTSMQPQTNRVIRVLFVRHGETEHNKTRTIAGHQPGKLTPTGISQAEKIGIYLGKQKRIFDHIYVSDLGRTRETFENAALKYPELKKISTTFTPLVRQRSGGICEGKPLNTWQNNAKKQGKDIRVYKCEGSESWIDVNKRASKLLQTLIKTHLIENKSEKQSRILVVTHGGFIMEWTNVFKRIHGKQQKFDNSAKNCSMHEYQIAYPEQHFNKYEESKVEIKCVVENFVGHL